MLICCSHLTTAKKLLNTLSRPWVYPTALYEFIKWGSQVNEYHAKQYRLSTTTETGRREPPYALRLVKSKEEYEGKVPIAEWPEWQQHDWFVPVATKTKEGETVLKFCRIQTNAPARMFANKMEISAQRHLVCERHHFSYILQLLTPSKSSMEPSSSSAVLT
jgi:hypothetical protein